MDSRAAVTQMDSDVVVVVTLCGKQKETERNGDVRVELHMLRSSMISQISFDPDRG